MFKLNKSAKNVKELEKEEAKKEEIISSHTEGLNYTKNCTLLPRVQQIYCENEDIFLRFTGSEAELKKADSKQLEHVGELIGKIAEAV